MRLLVTGGSGFLGGYVLDEARRRGHEVVALARSDTAAAAVARHGARPLTGDFDDPAALAGRVQFRAVLFVAEYCVSGFRARAGDRGGRPGGGHRSRRLRLDHRGDDPTPRPLEAGPAERRAADPGIRAEVDDPPSRP